jgi:hypothetical protein
MVLATSGELVSRLVCLKCAARGVTVVPTQRKGTPCTNCDGEHDATFCSGCTNDLAHNAAALVLRPYEERIRGLAIAHQGSPIGQGLTMAADVLAARRMVPVSPGKVAAASPLRLNGKPARVGAADDVEDLDEDENPEVELRTAAERRIDDVVRAIGGGEPPMRPLLQNLEKAERIVLGVLIARHPIPTGRAELAILAGYTVSSSSFLNALGALRSSGLALGGNAAIHVTDEGRAVGPLALAGAGIQREHVIHDWIAKVRTIKGAGACGSKILRALVDAYPGHLTRDALAERIKHSPTSSSFLNALGKLRTLHLATKGRKNDPIAATVDLMGSRLANAVTGTPVANRWSHA